VTVNHVKTLADALKRRVQNAASDIE